MSELPTFKVELNALELGVLIGALMNNGFKISPRIWKVTEQFYPIQDNPKASETTK